MNSILIRLLGVIRAALQDPEDKEAVKIAQDGLIFWEDVAANPKLLQLETDIGEYEKIVAARHPAPPARDPLPGEGPQPDIGGRPSGANRGGLMSPGV